MHTYIHTYYESFQGKGKGKGKAKRVVEKEEPDPQKESNDASDSQIKKLRSLDVFAGCGGKFDDVADSCRQIAVLFYAK